MSIDHPRLKGIVAAIGLLVMYSIPFAPGAEAQVVGPDALTVPPAEPAPAPQADLQDEAALLAALAGAGSAAEASRYDRQLKALWSKSGSAAMDLLLKRGRDAMEVENLPAAIEHLTALTDHAPEFAEGFHARASAFFHSEMFGPAVADLEKALYLNPNNYNAIFGLGAVLETFGDETRALAAYRRVLALHPHHEDATEALKRLEAKVEGQSL